MKGRIPYAGAVAPKGTVWERPSNREEKPKNRVGPAACPPPRPAEAYEVGYFSQKHRLDRAKAIEILMRAGQNREKADQLALEVLEAARR
jgi:hypothetical protein